MTCAICNNYFDCEMRDLCTENTAPDIVQVGWNLVFPLMFLGKKIPCNFNPWK